MPTINSAMGAAVLLALLGWMTPAAHAAIPGELLYQGFLRDADGAPVSDTVSIDLALYLQTNDDEPLWQESHADVEVVGGRFEVMMGEHTPLAPELMAAGRLYLGLSINDDETFPRQALGAVPFALRAAQADDVAGQDIHPRSVTVGDQEVIDASGQWVGPPPGGGGGPRVVDATGRDLGPFHGNTWREFSLVVRDGDTLIPIQVQNEIDTQAVARDPEYVVQVSPALAHVSVAYSELDCAGEARLFCYNCRLPGYESGGFLYTVLGAG